MMKPITRTWGGMTGWFATMSTLLRTASSVSPKPASHLSKSMPQCRANSMRSADTPRRSMFATISLPLMCCAPQFVWATIMMSSTPSSHTAISSERMTLPKGCATSAPATLMIFASPFFSPSAASSSAVRRVSMHETMASFLSGYLSVA